MARPVHLRPRPAGHQCVPGDFRRPPATHPPGSFRGDRGRLPRRHCYRRPRLRSRGAPPVAAAVGHQQASRPSALLGENGGEPDLLRQTACRSPQADRKLAPQPVQDLPTEAPHRRTREPGPPADRGAISLGGCLCGSRGQGDSPVGLVLVQGQIQSGNPRPANWSTGRFA